MIAERCRRKYSSNEVHAVQNECEVEESSVSSCTKIYQSKFLDRPCLIEDRARFSCDGTTKRDQALDSDQSQKLQVGAQRGGPMQNLLLGNNSTHIDSLLILILGNISRNSFFWNPGGFI